MKKYKNNFKLLALSLVVVLSSCSDDFIERPSEDSFNSENFFATDAQVQNTTLAFYSRIWWDFDNKWNACIGDLGAGNIVGGADGNDLSEFKLTSASEAISTPWYVSYSVIAQSNNIINNLAKNAGPNVSPQAINTAIAEAHFMRGLAYFYLVRIFKEVPIIEDNLAVASEPFLYPNFESDVYTLIKKDFLYAANNLPVKMRGSNYANNIKISSGTAKSFLAKACLQNKDYTDAAKYATEVIDSGEFKLLGTSDVPGTTYNDLFTYKYNNNEETIFAWQHEARGYFFSNTNTIQYGIPNLTLTNYGATYVPSVDLQTAFTASGVSDVRRKASYMKVGDSYPELLSDSGQGFTMTADSYPDGYNTSNAFIKKYVIGKQTGATGAMDGNGSSLTSYIMRYSDVLLIQAEALLAGAASTTNPVALASFNKVRNRAGLPSVTTITKLGLLNERRLEFAFEGQYWYDLQRLPSNEAIALISAQDRGKFGTVLNVTPKAADLYFPKPADELINNPNLGKPAVAYQSN